MTQNLLDMAAHTLILFGGGFVVGSLLYRLTKYAQHKTRTSLASSIVKGLFYVSARVEALAEASEQFLITYRRTKHYKTSDISAKGFFVEMPTMRHNPKILTEQEESDISMYFEAKPR